MRLIKLAVASVIILFLIITFIGLLFPSKVIVSRAVDIAAPKDSIYTYTRNLLGWQLWVSSLQNQNIASEFETKLGNSIIKLSSSTQEKVVGEWIEKNGDKQSTTLSIISDSNNVQSVVQWQFEQQIKWYPWARFSSMINDKVIGAMMEQNLANLKKIAEK